MPRIRIVGLAIGLHLFLNNVEVQVDVNGDVAVAPGTYHWKVRNEAQVELASGDVFVEACTTATATPTATPPEGSVLPTEGTQAPTGQVKGR